jgi:hypothetical protein
MFNTIAMQNSFNVYCPIELSTINSRHDWIFNEIKEKQQRFRLKYLFFYLSKYSLEN